MSNYLFKPNPKQKVIDKIKHLFGKDAKIDLTGLRMDHKNKQQNTQIGHYYVECYVNDQKIASSSSKDWRKAYDLLAIELEKVFEEELYKSESV